MINEKSTWQDVGGSFSDKSKNISELHQEKYMPHARQRITQLQTSALQMSLAKPFAVIRSKVVPSLSWFGLVTKMAEGTGENYMRTICSRQLFTAITTVIE